MNAGDYIGSSVFTVDIYGVELSFSRISGIGMSAEFETYTEGGGRMHLLPKPKTSAGTLTFEKGMSVVDRQTAKILTPGSMVADIQITLKKNGKTVESYYIESALVTSWQLADLDAMSPSIVMNSFQLAHNGLRKL